MSEGRELGTRILMIKVGKVTVCNSRDENSGILAQNPAAYPPVQPSWHQETGLFFFSLIEC